MDVKNIDKTLVASDAVRPLPDAFANHDTLFEVGMKVNHKGKMREIQAFHNDAGQKLTDDRGASDQVNYGDQAVKKYKLKGVPAPVARDQIVRLFSNQL